MNTKTPTPGSAARVLRAISTEQATAEVLLWQMRARMGAVIVGSFLVLVRYLGDHGARPAKLGLGVLVFYGAITLVIGLIINRTGRASRIWIWITIATDIFAIMQVTYVSTPPENYAQALLIGFIVLHYTEFHFGRRYAQGTLVAIMGAYLVLVAPVTGIGRVLEWSAELISLALFAIAGGMFVVLYGSYKERLAGIVELFTRTEQGDFTAEFPTTVDSPPDSVTMVGNAYNRVRSQLGNLVLTDPLSGLLNRRGLERDLAREIARAVRSGKELALVAIDVDHFKTINDTLGHLAGDDVIREVGALLREVKRGGDVVARTGGDEFTLLLPETGAAGAFRLASRIRELVRTHDFKAVHGRVPVTVSVGLVADKVADEDVAHDLHSRADEALYAAKESGRDRVTIWNANMRAFVLTRTAETAVKQ
jgi:diguanylate cyclase (GGDEF)-like protein